ncbi:MAG: DUF485 domain-containing protein [Pseudomonadota bacterium]|nr:DUF485 domain-containing protein [Sphingomonas sp.]MDQ3471201.1 DUF485 domain-containing protein [Pseudomonadota bacterium]
MPDQSKATPEPAAGAERSGLLRVSHSPRYQQLLAERARFSWALTLIMLAIFFGYILLIAFAPGVLAARIGDGTTTIGIPIGLGVIISGIALTGVYVHRANSRYDPLIAAIVEETLAEEPGD